MAQGDLRVLVRLMGCISGGQSHTPGDAVRDCWDCWELPLYSQRRLVALHQVGGCGHPPGDAVGTAGTAGELPLHS